ncbi:MAG: hypothetical protein Ct9H300mP25_04120 [Acidobacteriota bacterium]|nr:MAG: hypothetical protein Ct9H300mP25_04120 [Acidobacteriota bacterium]
MTKQLVAAARAAVDRLCAFQYRAFQHLSMLHIHKRHLFFGVLAGLASMAAACSGGDTPTAPSKTTGTMQFHRGSNDTDVSRDGVGKTVGRKDKRGHAGQKHSPGDRRRRIEYCRNLSAGHQDYDKCQQWLDKIARRGPDRGDAPKKPVTARVKNDVLSTANRLNQGIKTTKGVRTGFTQRTNPLATVTNNALSFIFTHYSFGAFFVARTVLVSQKTGRCSGIRCLT